jgi:hypothetical protein
MIPNRVSSADPDQRSQVGRISKISTVIYPQDSPDLISMRPAISIPPLYYLGFCANH